MESVTKEQAMPSASVGHNRSPNAGFFKTCRYLEKNPMIHLVLARPLFMDKARTLKEGNIFQHPQVFGFITHRRHGDYGMMSYTSAEFEAIYEMEMLRLRDHISDHKTHGFVLT